MQALLMNEKILGLRKQIAEVKQERREKVGNYIAVLRIENEMTREDLAHALNCSYQTIWHIENHRRLPGHDLAQAMAKLFDVSVDSILNGDPDHAA